jgi:hypothetical protein
MRSADSAFFAVKPSRFLAPEIPSAFYGKRHLLWANGVIMPIIDIDRFIWPSPCLRLILAKS